MVVVIIVVSNGQYARVLHVVHCGVVQTVETWSDAQNYSQVVARQALV